MRCQRKDHGRLFQCEKRPGLEEVHTNTYVNVHEDLYVQTHQHRPSVIAGTVYPTDHIKTFSGYCTISQVMFINILSFHF